MNQIFRTPAPAGQAKERRGVPATPPVQIAHIVSVAGSHAIAILERSSSPTIKDPRVQIGALVKIVTPGSSVMGLVSAVTAPMPNADGHDEMGLIEINLAGEVGIDDTSRRLTFRRGVSQLPSIGDPVLAADPGVDLDACRDRRSRTHPFAHSLGVPPLIVNDVGRDREHARDDTSLLLHSP